MRMPLPPLRRRDVYIAAARPSVSDPRIGPSEVYVLPVGPGAAMHVRLVISNWSTWLRRSAPLSFERGLRRGLRISRHSPERHTGPRSAAPPPLG